MEKNGTDCRSLTDEEIAAVVGGYASREDAQAALKSYNPGSDTGQAGWIDDFGGGGDWYIHINPELGLGSGFAQWS